MVAYRPGGVVASYMLVVLLLFTNVSPAEADEIDATSAFSCATKKPGIFLVTDGDGSAILDDETNPLVDPDSRSCEVDDLVTWTTMFPEKIRVGDHFEVSGSLYNDLLVPLAITLEYTPKTSTICSVTGFTTDAGVLGTDMVILSPKGEDLLVDGVLWKERATFGLSANADAIGDCSIQVSAVVSFLDDDTDIAVGSHSEWWKVLAPLVANVNLGTYTANCALDSFTKADVPASKSVVAGDVDFTMSAEVAECTNRWNQVLVAVELADPNGGDGTGITRVVTSGQAGAEGSETGKIWLDEGEHTVNIHGIYVDHALVSADCIIALIGVGLSIGTVVLLTAALVLLVIAIWLDVACTQSTLFSQFDTVKITAENLNAPEVPL